MQTDGTLQSGKHWMRLEEDILYCKYVGMITASDVQTSMSLLEGKFQAGVTYYVICDVSEVTGMEAAARKISTDWFARHDIGGTVQFGAGTVTRAIAALILSLMRLLHKHDMKTQFVKTEEDARAWVQEQRLRRATAKSSR